MAMAIYSSCSIASEYEWSVCLSFSFFLLQLVYFKCVFLNRIWIPIGSSSSFNITNALHFAMNYFIIIIIIIFSSTLGKSTLGIIINQNYKHNRLYFCCK